MERYSFTASNIWNTDETGVSTVLKPPKIVAKKGSRQVGSITSGERGTNVTLITAISANGTCIPPMFLFPRKNYKDYFIRGGPPDSIGAANSSGWMTEETFLVFMKHFIRHVKPSKEQHVLLLLDNHSSHLGIPVLNLAKDNGVVMLSFPPHCSHRLQPLDVGVYGPFKKYLSSAQDAWLRNNAGKTMTIYDIPAIVNTAYPLAMCPTNILNSFRRSGIFPYNRHIFTDSDFAPSYVSDRPCPIDEPVIPAQEGSVQHNGNSTEAAEQAIIVNPLNNQPRQDLDKAIPGSSGSFSPHLVKPLPKAGPRKNQLKGRKRRHTAILTDTPEKEALEKENNLRKEREHKKKKKIVKKNVFSTKNKTTYESSSDSEEETFCLVCCDKYSNSLASEEWVQCLGCKLWAHSKCIKGSSKIFYCLNCNSDSD